MPIKEKSLPGRILLIRVHTYINISHIKYRGYSHILSDIVSPVKQLVEVKREKQTLSL